MNILGLFAKKRGECSKLEFLQYPLWWKLYFPVLFFPRNDTIDAYLDDTPILEYARTTMDAKCTLRLVGEGFGEDGYGIGLPKGSWLKVSNP